MIKNKMKITVIMIMMIIILNFTQAGYNLCMCKMDQLVHPLKLTVVTNVN